jgi:ribosomal protein S18 acetylase RimI-like enzyme
MTNTKNTPIESLEDHYPFRVVTYRLRRGSGGAGLHPGGDGIERDLQVLEDCTVSLITERRASRPWGLAGGGPGARGENWRLPGGDESRAERLPDKCTVPLRAGDVVRMLTPGGGGWGGPADAAVEEPAPVVELVPMEDPELAAFLARSRGDYLTELMDHGMTPEAASAKVDAEQSAAFPDGRPADGHQVFAVRRGDEPVGHLWLGPAPDGAPGSWWVWEVTIDEAAQGQGIGRRTMELAEVEARRAGATSLGLSVAGANLRARRLYESLGYEPVTTHMRKPLE